MTDVFVSYAHEDQEIATLLVDRLRSEGWDVYWDADLLAGEPFANVLQQQVRLTPAVVVLWSSSSVMDESFVYEEANLALRRGTLVPISIDDVELPFGYTRFHTPSFLGWDGDTASRAFRSLTRAIAAKVDASDGPAGAEEEPVDEPQVVPEPVPTIAPAAADAGVRLLQESVAEAERNASTPDGEAQLLIALARLADHLQRSGSHAEAEAYYERARQSNHTMGGELALRIDRGLVRSLTALGRNEEAIVPLEEIAGRTRAPADRHALAALIADCLEAVVNDQRSRLSDRHDRGVRLIEQLNDVLIGPRLRSEEDGWPPELLARTRSIYVRALSELGTAALQLGERTAATALLEEYFLAAPRDTVAWPALDQLAHEYMAMGDLAQAAGTDQAHQDALGRYALAREIFTARGSRLGLHVVLRRCAEMVLALGDMDEFARLEHERATIEEQIKPGADREASAGSELQWPVWSLAVVALVDVEPASEEAQVATVRLRNDGSLSWRADRSLRAWAGRRHKSGYGASGVTLESGRNVPPGGTVELRVPIRSGVTGAEHVEAFVQQWGLPWEPTPRFSYPLPATGSAG